MLTPGSGPRAALTRAGAFEASHRYWVDAWDPETNLARFGRTAGPYGHGHNYVVHATAAGPVDPITGMVLNLVDLDAALRAAIAPLDHRFLNLDCASLLRGRQPSTEVLALVLWEALERELARRAPPDAALVRVRLAETDDLAAIADREVLPMIRLVRAYTFSAAHRLARTDLDDAANRQIYGKCANPYGHGHDYRLEVVVSGDLDPTTGMAYDLVVLDRVVHEQVVDPWDHRHLNQEIPPFDRVVPTAENIARVAWDRLRPHLGPALEKVVIHETPRASAEYAGGSPDT